jgi:hypothetical protein
MSTIYFFIGFLFLWLMRHSLYPRVYSAVCGGVAVPTLCLTSADSDAPYFWFLLEVNALKPRQDSPSCETPRDPPNERFYNS